MSGNEKSLSVDSPSEDEAVKKGSAALGVPASQVVIKSRRKLPSGLYRFEMATTTEVVGLSIDELIDRVNVQLVDIDTQQFIKGYSESDLQEKGLLTETVETEVHHGGARKCGIFEIPKDIDYFDCEEVLLQDHLWLLSIHRLKPCTSGSVIASLGDASMEKATAAIGVLSFVPPLADDVALIMPRAQGKSIQYLACLPGRVLICKNKIYLLPVDMPGQLGAFNIQNPMEATCNFVPPFGKGKSLTLEGVQTFLTYSKVKFGVRDSDIEKAIQESTTKNKEVSNICIAKGMPKIDGKNAYMERMFGSKLESEEYQIGADGKIDYHRKVIIPTAKEGDLLARVTLPSSGQPGIDIFGNMLPASEGKPLLMSAGEGVQASVDGREFYATRVGQVNYGPDAIRVFPVFEVDGDVDSHCGNIDFEGCVLIRGSILSGFAVRAKGNIEIKGDIQGATVESGRDLLVSGGIIGGQNTVIKVGRNLVARHLLNAIVEVEGDVHVLNSCMHSTIDTTGQFYCIEGKGVVIGGAIMAMRGGRSRELGSESGAKTLVVCGQDFLVRKKMKETQTILSQLQADLKKLDVYLVPLLQKIREVASSLPPEQKAKIATLLGHRKQLEMNCNIMNNRLRRLDQTSVMPDGIKFWVYEKAYPGVRVQICETYWVPEKECGRVVISTDPKTRKIRLLAP